jgi:hypothetical protein
VSLTTTARRGFNGSSTDTILVKGKLCSSDCRTAWIQLHGHSNSPWAHYCLLQTLPRFPSANNSSSMGGILPGCRWRISEPDAYPALLTLPQEDPLAPHQQHTSSTQENSSSGQIHHEKRHEIPVKHDLNWSNTWPGTKRQQHLEQKKPSHPSTNNGFERKKKRVRFFPFEARYGLSKRDECV